MGSLIKSRSGYVLEILNTFMGTSAQHLPQTERLLQKISTKRNIINIYTDTIHTAADTLEYYGILEQFDNVRRALLFPSPSCLRQCRCYCRE